MLTIDLPLLQADSNISDAFDKMYRAGVSGVVVEGPDTAHRLMHVVDLRNASENNVTYLQDVHGGIFLDSPFEFENLDPDYLINHMDGDSARVQFRRERLADIYKARIPVYCCDKTPRHYYPPNKRGSDDKCVVPGSKER